MEKKLIKEEISKVFAMYWGCEFVSQGVEGVNKISALNSELLFSEGEEECLFEESKLLLTPLSAITHLPLISLTK